MKSRNRNALPILFFILAILYHNSSFFAMMVSRHYRNAIWTSEIGSTLKLFSYLSSSQGFTLRTAPSLIRDYQKHVRNIILQHNERIWNFEHLLFSTKGQNGNGDDKNGEGKEDEKKDEDQKEEQKEGQKEDISRIPTYDEFARFRDSSRPPDSHYPPGPGYKRSGCHNLRKNLYLYIFIISVSNFLL